MTSTAHNVGALLTKLGRNSTPPVKNSPFGISLGSLTGITVDQDETATTLLVGSNELVDAWPDHLPMQLAIPGLITEQASQPHVSYMVIDVSAFDSGPWLGADNGGNAHLTEELFEAGRLLRARGAIVFYLPHPSHNEGPEAERLKSTSTVNTAEIPEEDLEEQAPQSDIWDVVLNITERRSEGDL